MTIEELEKYCIDQSMKCKKKAYTSSTQDENRYHAGQANAFMWIAAVIQNGKHDENAKHYFSAH